ncbi:MAG: DUF4339 domain-containing protein [Planctomycetota bacterium]
MTKRWYYQMLMEEFGPVTAEQLSALIEEGTVAGTDLVRAEHSDRWFEASFWSPEAPAEEASAEGGEIEEISDLSQLSFEFENSGDSGRTRSNLALPAETPGGLAPPSASVSAGDDEEPANFFYQSFGQTMGPLPLSNLVSLAEAGAISETDLVRVGQSGSWKVASSIEELSIALMTAEKSVDHAPQLSLATQKRLGEQATAVALAPEKPAVVESAAPSLQAESPSLDDRSTADPSDSQSEVETRSRKSSGKGKGTRKEAARRREDALIDGILEDVFSEEPAPSRPSMASSAMNMGSGPVASSTGPAATSSPSPSLAATMNNSAAMAPRPTFTPMSKSSSSSTDSMMPLLKMAGMVVLVIGVLVGGYFGLSGLTGPPIDLYVTKLKTAAIDLKKLGDKPTETQWLSFCAKKNEFTSYQDTILEANASGEAVDKCKLAITMLLRATGTSYKQPGEVKKASEEFLKAVEKL